MKAIYKGQDILCVVAETKGDRILLEPVDDTAMSGFWVDFGDERLILDPTDDEVSDTA